MKEDCGVLVYDYNERLYRDAKGSFFLYIIGGRGKRLTNDEAILWIRNHASARDFRSLLKWCFPIMSKEKKDGKKKEVAQ